MIATPNWAAGIINHGSYAELERCLTSLRAQTHPPSTIRVLDTGVDPEQYQALADRERSVTDDRTDVLRGQRRGDGIRQLVGPVV